MQVNKNQKIGMKEGTARKITVERKNKTSFFQNLKSKVKSLVSNRNNIEEAKMERKEIKNFNRKVITNREEINTNVRMFMFTR